MRIAERRARKENRFHLVHYPFKSANRPQVWRTAARFAAENDVDRLEAAERLAGERLEHFLIALTHSVQSSTRGRHILDRPVEPGDDS